jgi:hypothetical protein
VLPAGDIEPAIPDLLGDVDRCERPYASKLIAEIAIERLEPVRQIHNGFTVLIEHGDKISVRLRAGSFQ